MLGKHPFGIYEKAFDPDDPWKIRLKKAKELGFDYMEISIDEQDHRIARLDWTASTKRELREICSDLNIPLRSMCLSVHRRYPFGSAVAENRAKAHELMEKALEFSAEMGIRVIQLAGYDVYYEPSTAQSVEYFAEAMAWSAEKAAEYQVMLGMEIMDTTFMNSITKHLVYEERICSPWYRVYPDLGNLSAWSENHVEQELRKGINSMVACHVKDTRPVTATDPGCFKGVEFGEGCVNFSDCFRLLETLGYCGPYMMERWFKPGESDYVQIARSVAYIETQFRRGTEG